eukprot:TRINITY_DN61285_c0_g1_i1.p1 TRINITY_DN61285_c0_g1~~TRINITY_DN61285_c0_g1_i1.p1  ORF type:complete len:337 (+),score=36.39 TRINITY_DN61285_c0_g1_i1:35-1045(+)
MEAVSSSSALCLLEHVNLNIIDPRGAEDFFVSLLGAVKNPIGSNARQIHFNLGACQFHMPFKLSVARQEPVEIAQVWPGEILIWVAPESFASLAKSLVQRSHGGDEHPSVTQSWDNVLRSELRECVVDWHGTPLRLVPSPNGSEVPPMGMHPGGSGLLQHVPLLRHRVAPGAAEGLARWYHLFLGAYAEVRAHEQNRDGAPTETNVALASCVVHFDTNADWPQKLVFEEDPSLQIPEENRSPPEEAGYHICVYVKCADIFKELFDRAEGAGALFVNERFEGGPVEFASASDWQQANAAQQYRVRDLRDPQGGALLLQLEHEVRSPEHKCCPLGRIV